MFNNEINNEMPYSKFNFERTWFLDLNNIIQSERLWINWNQIGFIESQFFF